MDMPAVPPTEPGSAPPVFATPGAPVPGAPTSSAFASGGSTLDRLIRAPDALLAAIDGAGGTALLVKLTALGIAGHLAYGIVVGSFAGGMQWWAAPLKIVLGKVLVAAACLPSLYIFACFTGAEVRGKHVLGLTLGLFALSGVFLTGFAPVVWVFSQSSTLTSFVGAIHILVWLVSIVASARVLHASLRRWKARNTGLVSLWLLILVVTAMQMMTTLRPLVGSSTRLFESERMFFLQNWAKTMEADSEAR